MGAGGLGCAPARGACVAGLLKLVKEGVIAPSDRVVGAMEAFKTVMRDRPGATRVVIHVPGPGGGEMELRRGVAYDAEMLAEVRRRLGDGLVDLRLS